MRVTQFPLDDDERREGMVCLVLLLGGVDELLLAVPAIRALKRALPRHSLVLAGHPVVGAAAVDWQLADATLPARPWHLPRLPSPDTAADLTDAGPESHRLLLELRPRRLVAAASPELRVGGPKWQLWQGDRPLREHRTARWCRIVSACLDIEVDTRDGLLTRPVSVTRPRGTARPVLLHPGGPADRRWPAGRFTALARALAGRGEEVRVVGTGDDRLAEAVAGATDAPAATGPGSVQAWRPRTLRDLAAGVAAARAVVAGDTAVGHLAAAYAVPGVHLHGPTLPRERGPLALGRRVRVLAAPRGEGPGGGAGDGAGDLRDLALDEVAAAAAEVLDGSAGDAGAAPGTPVRQLRPV